MACASAAVILFAFAASPADALGVRNATSSVVKAASIRFHADSNTQSRKAAMEYESEILGALDADFMAVKVALNLEKMGTSIRGT